MSSIFVTSLLVLLVVFLKRTQGQFSEEEERLWNEAREKFNFQEQPEMDDDEKQ